MDFSGLCKDLETRSDDSSAEKCSENDLMMRFVNEYKSMGLETRHRFLQRFLKTINKSDLSFIHSFVSTSQQLRIDFISKLPPELSVMILVNLEGEQCIRSARVSRQWHKIIHDNDLWRRICRIRGWTDHRFDNYHNRQPNHMTSLALTTYNPSNSVVSTSSSNTPLVSTPGSSSGSSGSGSGKRFNPTILNNLTLMMCPEWKQVFLDKYLTKNNWESGKYRLRTIKPMIPASPQTNTNINNNNNRNPLNGGAITDLEQEAGMLIDEQIESITMSFDDSLENAVSMSWNGRISQGHLWEMNSGMTRFNLSGHQGSISAVKIACHQIVTGGVDRQLRVWDAKTGQCRMVLEGHEGEIECLQFDHRFIVSGSQDKTIRIWELSTGAGLGILRGHVESVTCIQMDQESIVSGSGDCTIRLWTIGASSGGGGGRQRPSVPVFSQTQTLTGHEGTIYCLAMDRSVIVSGSADCKIKIWDRSTGNLKRTLEGHRDGVVCLQFDGDKIVSGSSDQTIKVWSYKSGSVLYSLDRHRAPIWNLKFDENKLVSTSFDRTVLEWNFGGFDGLSPEEREKYSPISSVD